MRMTAQNEKIIARRIDVDWKGNERYFGSADTVDFALPFETLPWLSIVVGSAIEMEPILV